MKIAAGGILFRVISILTADEFWSMSNTPGLVNTEGFEFLPEEE